jgi:predicted RecA/RadA family phage recombinase
MATVQLQRGNAIDYTPETATAAGAVVVVGGIVGVTQTRIAAGELGALIVDGCGEFPKNTSVALDEGDIAYWDVADDEANADDTNPVLGKVIEDAAEAATTVKVRLCPDHIVAGS